jgi:hypothetical protein
MVTVLKVLKVQINNFKFVATEVLETPETPEDISKRKAALEKAMILGNGYRTKTIIVFETTEGFKQVETHIWASTEKDVTLKGGILIPIRCIHQVNFNTSTST